MKKSLFDKWIAALESGEYARGHGALQCKRRFKNQYCCLGVLADVIDPEAWRESDTPTMLAWGPCSGEDVVFLPDDVLDYEVQRRLASYNDQTLEEDFSAIVPYILEVVEVEND